MDQINRREDQVITRLAYRRDDEEASPISHVVMFWLFLAVAGFLFATAVLVPVFEEHQDVLAAKDKAQQRIDKLKKDLQRKQDIARALVDDPIVNENTTLRELNFHILGQEVVRTTPEMIVRTTKAPPARQEFSSPSAWLGFVPEDYFKPQTWIELVHRPDIRRWMLVVSAVLMGAAMVLFSPPAPRGLFARFLDSEPTAPTKLPGSTE